MQPTHCIFFWKSKSEFFGVVINVFNAFKFETNETLITTCEGVFTTCTSRSKFSLDLGLTYKLLRFVFGFLCCVDDFL